MFDLHTFILDTILEMVGKEPEYRVRQYALGWFDKGLLTQDDLARIAERYAELAAEALEAEVDGE